MKVQPPLEFIPPSLNPLVLRFTQTFLPLWIKFNTNITTIEAQKVETLAELYQQFQTGKIRLLMAFRHPSTNDPFCLGYLLGHILNQEAKKKGISLKSPLHAHFMYDRGIPLWAGAWVGWLASNLGATSILRGKIDVVGLKAARNLLVNGKFPLTAAPEGATNGHNEIVSALEPGVAQLAFWGVEDIEKAQRSEKVILLPIGIQYFYIHEIWQEIEKLLTKLEAESGLKPTHTDSSPEVLYERLYGLGEHLLSMLENFYRKFYHRDIPEESNLSSRLQNLLNIALEVAEEYFATKPTGNYVDCCRRLEQAGWNYIYRSDLPPLESLSSVEKGLADRLAQEADLRMWHMRLVERFVSVSGYYVKEKPTVERFGETLLILSDLVTRIKGENPYSNVELGKQKALITIGEPIDVSERSPDYKNNRRQAVGTLTKDLQSALEEMIITDSKPVKNSVN